MVTRASAILVISSTIFSPTVRVLPSPGITFPSLYLLALLGNRRTVTRDHGLGFHPDPHPGAELPFDRFAVRMPRFAAGDLSVDHVDPLRFYLCETIGHPEFFLVDFVSTWKFLYCHDSKCHE